MNALRTSLAAAALLTSSSSHAQVAETKSLTSDGARAVIAAAVAHAHGKNTTGVIAVVDNGGNLMALERIDGTFAAGANIAIGKARTAPLFQKPTHFLEDAVNQGRTAMMALDGFTPLQGGVPISVDGQIAGAIGVSGAATAQEDEEPAMAGADALKAAPTVTYFPKDDVKTAFAKGSVLFDRGEKYMVHASRREHAGMAEIHTQDADIVYVLEGAATLVTGGKAVNAKPAGPHAKLAFYRAASGPAAIAPSEVNVEVTRVDPAIDAIVPANPKIYKLAEGFQFTEGPVWVSDGGYLLFSDPNANTIYRYQPRPGNEAGELSVFRQASGYSGPDIKEYGQPGANGLTLDASGRLTINEHGNHRVSRLEKDGGVTVLAARYDGKRLNSPNDLVYRSDGTLFFTDPPFGLPKFFADARKQLPYSGVFSIHDGRLQLVSTDLTGPNGIAFSPDEKYLMWAIGMKRRK